MQNLEEMGRTLTVGASSLVALEHTPEVIAAFNPQNANSLGQLIIQTIIGIITIWQLIKKSKPKKE